MSGSVDDLHFVQDQCMALPEDLDANNLAAVVIIKDHYQQYEQLIQ